MFFGWPAIHTRNRGKEEGARIDNIFIDCGCETKEEVENLAFMLAVLLLIRTISWF